MQTKSLAKMLLFGGLMIFAAGCAARSTDAPGYIKTINEKNKTRYIRPDCFDKDAFMKKGYIETTDATGRTFYIKPFKSDAGVDNTFPRDSGGRDRHRSGKIIEGGGKRR